MDIFQELLALQAVRTRLATDLRVVLADEHMQRPSEMACCLTLYNVGVYPNVDLRVQFLCPVGCRHIHHQHEVLVAGC